MAYAHARKQYRVPLSVTDDLGMPDPHDALFFRFLGVLQNATCGNLVLPVLLRPPLRRLFALFSPPTAQYDRLSPRARTGMRP